RARILNTRILNTRILKNGTQLLEGVLKGSLRRECRRHHAAGEA
ncbi:MAG: hypothetical protein ACI91B_001019, partial [Planctomycetota bacterium]